MKILFICEGNMMRSQMAEAFYNEMTDTNDAISAGTAAEEKPQPSPRAIQAMKEVGIAIEGNASTQLTDEMVEHADKIILFPTNYTPSHLPKLDKVEEWDVIDPGYHTDQGMPLVYEVRDEIKRRVEKLIEKTK